MKVYFDHAASTPISEHVINGMNEGMRKTFGNPQSVHNPGKEANLAIDQTRENILKLINGDGNIIFTSGGTESNNLAFSGIVSQLSSGHIITSSIEHSSILEQCKYLESKGFTVTYVPVSIHGVVNLEDIENALQDDTIIVSIQHVNNEIGTIQPIREIGLCCKRKNIVFHVDASQSFCKIPLNVRELNIQLLTLSAHKINGPKGVGALYVSNNCVIQTQSYGGNQENSLRAGTQNVVGIIGLGLAIEEKYPIEKMKTLQEYFERKIMTIPGVKIHSTSVGRSYHISSVSFENIEAEILLEHLNHSGVYVSKGSACTSHVLEESHVLKALGLSSSLSLSTIRFSFGPSNSFEEVDYCVKETSDIVSNIRAIEVSH